MCRMMKMLIIGFKGVATRKACDSDTHLRDVGGHLQRCILANFWTLGLGMMVGVFGDMYEGTLSCLSKAAFGTMYLGVLLQGRRGRPQENIGVCLWIIGVWRVKL